MINDEIMFGRVSKSVGRLRSVVGIRMRPKRWFFRDRTFHLALQLN